MNGRDFFDHLKSRDFFTAVQNRIYVSLSYGFFLFVTQSMMSRRVKQYLSNLTIIQDEEKLRDMSQVCEPPQGSGKYIF